MLPETVLSSFPVIDVCNGEIHSLTITLRIFWGDFLPQKLLNFLRLFLKTLQKKTLKQAQKWPREVNFDFWGYLFPCEVIPKK